MNRCQELESYLAGMLHGEALAAFEEHVGRCAQCRSEVEESRLADEHFRAWSDRRRSPKHTPQMTAALIERASGRSAPAAFWPRPVLVAVGAVLVVTAISWLIFYRTGDERSSGGGATRVADRAVEVLYWEGGEEGALRRTDTGTMVLAPGNWRLVAGLLSDRVGLSADGRAEILRADREATQIRLDRGVLAVMARKRGPGESLRVLAGEWAVDVVGTRFEVSMTQAGSLAVGVSEGRVRLTAPDGAEFEVDSGQWAEPEQGAADVGVSELTGEQRDQIDGLLDIPASASALRRGGLEQADAPQPRLADPEPPKVETSDTASLGQNRGQPRRHADDPAPEMPGVDSALESPTGHDTEPKFDLAEVRQRIVNGEYRAAEDALTRHLDSAPGDLEAWSLLADTRRKDGRYRPAVAAYRQIIELGGPAQSNRARFKAAVLLQDQLQDQAMAASLFRAYLSRAPSLRPLASEALYRLAKADLALGHRASARGLLERILSDHAGSVAAVQARRLLMELGPAEADGQ